MKELKKVVQQVVKVPASKKSHKSSIFEQAIEVFSKSVGRKKKIPLELFQNFLNEQENILRNWHTSSEGGREIAKRRSDIVDVLLKNIFDLIVYQIGNKNDCKGLCIVAFGGYGRCEMNPFSDVDIIFLHEENKLTATQEKLISSTLMALWDLGFKIGHATRSINEAIIHANKEMISKTALLECRLLIGDKKIFRNFQGKFKKKCILKQEEEYLVWRLENIKKLREKFGKTVFMQEPNIKSGNGGLRDYQNLLWISIMKQRQTTDNHQIELKELSKSERKKLENAYDFLLRVRNEMHYQEERSNDQLTLLLQGKVAKAFGYPQRNVIRRSEAFMKDYYERTRSISLITTAVLERIKTIKKEEGFIKNFFSGRKKSEHIDEFIIKEGYLFPKNREIFKDKARLMRSFQLAQTRSLKFSPELSDLIKKNLLLVDRSFKYSKEVRRVFLNILSHKGKVGCILRLMHDLGFLGKYIPEFGALTCLVQHEFYHHYTADEHTLVCIEKIDALLLTEDKKLSRYSILFKNIDDAAMLYLGMLLHDIGKAANVESHAMASTIAAEKAARRLQIEEDRQIHLITLVSAHGELASVARTRDLDDSTTIIHFANTIKTLPTLDALMILTLADGMGTSDMQWSDWKEQLVWKLYDQTKKYLEIGDSFFEQQQRNQGNTKKEVQEMLTDDFREEIAAHFEQMPERYFRMMSSEEIVEHLKLFRSFFKHLNSIEGKPLNDEVFWKEYPEAGHTEVWVCGWDRKLFLECIAAAFLAAEINILSADIFTRRDNLMFDVFRVTSVRSDPLLNKKEKKIVESRLRELLENIEEAKAIKAAQKYLLTTRLEEEEETLVHVSIDNTAHPLYTLVEIETPDRRGLLYDLLGALNYQGISIDLARIATEMKAAIDVFYILGADKKKISNEVVLKELQQRVSMAALGEKGKYSN